MPHFDIHNIGLIVSSGPVLLLMAIVIEHLLPMKLNWHPLSFFCYVCQYLASKVNKGSSQQRQLAGSLLSIMLLTTAMLILALLDFISMEPTLFHLAILYFCLRGGNVWKNWQEVNQQLAIAKDQPFKKQDSQQQCKNLLKPFMLRKLDSLSAYGLQKACLEALPQHLALHWFAVIFYFILFDIEVTVFYVLVLEIAQQFNRKLSQFQSFGWLAGLFYKILALPPLVLVSLTVMLYGPMSSALVAGHYSAQRWHYWGSGFLLGVLSTNVNNTLGGPRIYPADPTQSATQSKVRYPDILSPGDNKKIKIETLQCGFNRLRYSAQLWLVVLIIITLFTLYFRLK